MSKIMEGTRKVYRCGYCNGEIRSSDIHCKYCGKRMALSEREMAMIIIILTALLVVAALVVR